MRRKQPTGSQKSLGISKAKVNFRKHERQAMSRDERRKLKEEIREVRRIWAENEDGPTWAEIFGA